jgi:protein subunit release factor B
MKTKEANSEFQNFNSAMSKILRADPKAVKEAMEKQQQENAEKRKAKKSSALGHASDDEA